MKRFGCMSQIPPPIWKIGSCTIDLLGLITRSVFLCLHLWKICISHHNAIQPPKSQFWKTFLGRTNILRSELGPLGHHVQHKMCQDVSLVKQAQKALENSIAKFTEYLNSCVCLHQRKLRSWKQTICLIHQIFWQKQTLLHTSGNSCFSFTRTSQQVT